MFEQQQDWANEPCYYVTAIDGITRIALLAGPYSTKDMAERVVRKASAWAIEESGDLKAIFYAYGVSKRYHGHDRSILGMIEP